MQSEGGCEFVVKNLKCAQICLKIQLMSMMDRETRIPVSLDRIIFILRASSLSSLILHFQPNFLQISSGAAAGGGFPILGISCSAAQLQTASDGFPPLALAKAAASK